MPTLLLVPVLGLGCRYDVPAVQPEHRACGEDADCVLLIGCGGCDLDAVNRAFADEYEPHCLGYGGPTCGRAAVAVDTASTDKWECNWQAVCADRRCEPACP